MISAINDLKRHIRPLQSDIEAALHRVVERGWLVLGPEVEAFEKEFAAQVGIRNCLSVANGTEALELALKAVGVGPGSRVLNVANAGMYSTLAILSLSATPVFVDLGPGSLWIDEDRACSRIREGSVDAVVVTHLFGQLVPMGRLVEAAAKAGIPVVEDCAQSHGARSAGRQAGTFGTLGCFSFYPTKNLGALGDGGAVVTEDPGLAKKVRELRQYGWRSKYVVETPGGRNSRLDEVQAAVLRVFLPHLDSWNRRRREIAHLYSERLDPGRVRVPEVRAEAEDYVGHLYVVRSTRRDELKAHLAGKGIASDIHYPVPDHRQAVLAARYADTVLPETEAACREILTLPCFPEMTDEEVLSVVQAINSW